MNEEKVNYKRANRMAGHGPHKMFKMAIKKYLDNKIVKDETQEEIVEEIREEST